jgi:acyl carrier protein
MRSEITELIFSALRDLYEELKLPGLAAPTAETRLIGSAAVLDSMALVSLIADLEGRISVQYGRDIVLADERAMSQLRSPFRTVDSLAAHIEGLLAETPKA